MGLFKSIANLFGIGRAQPPAGHDALAKVIARLEEGQRVEQQMLAKSYGSRTMAALNLPLGGYGINVSWLANRNEMARHYRGWVYVAVKKKCVVIAGNPPRVSKATTDQAPQSSLADFRRANGPRNKCLTEPMRRKAWTFLKEDDDLEPVDDDHPLVRLMRDPNEADTQFKFWHELMLFYYLTGNAYIWTPLNAYEVPCEMHVIPSHWVFPMAGKDHTICEYQVRPMLGSSSMISFPADEVIHIADPSPVSKIDGWSALTAAAQWVDTDESISQARWSSFKNGAFPSMAMELDKDALDPSPDDVRAIEEKFLAKFQGEHRYGRPIVLSPGVKLTPLSISPQEMAFCQCLDDETECLTESGWKKYTELTTATRIACYDPEAGGLVYHVPSAVHIANYSGVMYRWQGQRVDAIMTPNHRVYVEQQTSFVSGGELVQRRTAYRDSSRMSWCRQGGETGLKNIWGVKRVSDLADGRDYGVVAAAPVLAEDPPDVEIERFVGGRQQEFAAPYRIDPKTWLRFLGYYLSEGCLQCRRVGDGVNGWEINVCQKKHLDRFREGVLATPFRWRKESVQANGVAHWNASEKGLYHHLLSHCGAGALEKRIPEYVKAWPAEYLRVLLDALLEGDGTAKRPTLKGRGKAKNHKAGWNAAYYTSSKQLADDVMEIAVKCGVCASISSKKDKRPEYLGRERYTVSLASRAKIQVGPANRSETGYDGAIWCVTVPTGLFVVRRGGKAHVTGNSAEQMRDFVLALYGVPKTVVDPESTTYGATAAAQAAFCSLTLKPDFTMLGQIFTEKLAHRFASDLRVWWSDPSPDDPTQSLSERQAAFASGVITPNEWRQSLGMDPYEHGGDDPVLANQVQPWGTGKQPVVAGQGQGGPQGEQEGVPAPEPAGEQQAAGKPAGAAAGGQGGDDATKDAMTTAAGGIADGASWNLALPQTEKPPIPDQPWPVPADATAMSNGGGNGHGNGAGPQSRFSHRPRPDLANWFRRSSNGHTTKSVTDAVGHRHGDDGRFVHGGGGNGNGNGNGHASAHAAASTLANVPANLQANLHPAAAHRRLASLAKMAASGLLALTKKQLKKINPLNILRTVRAAQKASGKGVARAALIAAARRAGRRFRALRNKWGVTGAVAIGGAYAAYYTAAYTLNPSLLLIPVPLTATIFGSANVVRFAYRTAAGKKSLDGSGDSFDGGWDDDLAAFVGKSADELLADDDYLAEARAFVADVAEACGEEVPHMEDGLLAQVMLALLEAFEAHEGAHDDDDGFSGKAWRVKTVEDAQGHLHGNDGKFERIGYIGEHEEERARDRERKPLPYKTSLTDRLAAVASMVDRCFDGIAHEGVEETQASLATFSYETGLLAEEAVKKRIQALMRQCREEGGDGVKKLSTYRDAHEQAYALGHKAATAVGDTVKELSEYADDLEALSEVLPKALASLNKTLRMVAVDASVAIGRLRDEIEAGKQADRSRHLTGEPSEADAAMFPVEGHVRDVEWGETQETLDAWEASLPTALQALPADGKGAAVTLTKAERQAVYEYTTDGYEPLNHNLRDTTTPDEWGSRSRRLHKHLGNVFARLPVADKPVTVYRGLALTNQQTVAMLGRLKKAQASGKTIAFAGYSSTTFDPSVAAEYGGGGKKRRGGAGNDVVFEIAVRKGLNLGEMSQDSPSDNFVESELLLDHDSKFRVAAIREVPFRDPKTDAVVKRVVVQLVQEVAS